jgi:murein DD-endopeptidase MepM/ murein hydrolase activator NlpD
MTLEFKPFQRSNNGNHKNSFQSTSNANHATKLPNFILVESSSFIKQTDLVLRDVLQYKTLTDTSERVASLLSQSAAIFIAFISFVIHFINNIFYQTFLLLVHGFQSITCLPSALQKFDRKLHDLIKTISFSDTRDLWWLNIRVDVREKIHNFVNFLNTSFLVVRKFYLTAVVVSCLGILAINSNNTVSKPSNSYLSNFIERNSKASEQIVLSTPVQKFGLFTVNASASPIQKITQYTVQKGDDLDKISNFYGVSVQTLTTNNSDIKEGKVIEGQKIYIPWVDGYIFKTLSDTTLEQVASNFDIEKENILAQNSAVYNPDGGKFAKDTLVLIPTQDFDKIFKKIEADRAKQDQEKKNLILLRQSVSNLQSGTKTSTPFGTSQTSIWPTSGSISRCFSSGHRGCDIANFSSPPIVAFGDGVVTAVYRYDVEGYGNAVVITHANGIKSLYAHMADSSILVTKGQSISQGTQIGIMGQTGYATGIHLHFEIIDGGVQSDPLNYLP